MAWLFEIDTLGAAVLGVVVVADVPEVTLLEPLVVLVVALVVDEVAVVGVVVVFFALTVAPPAWAASPANSPLPASAPASDHRVIWRIRRRPASRSALVRGGRGVLLMARIVVPWLVKPLAGA